MLVFVCETTASDPRCSVPMLSESQRAATLGGACQVTSQRQSSPTVAE